MLTYDEVSLRTTSGQGRGQFNILMNLPAWREYA